jgi:hypothetical protein
VTRFSLATILGIALAAGCAAGQGAAGTAASVELCNPCFIEVRNLNPQTRDIRVGEPHSGLVIGALEPGTARQFTLPEMPRQVWATYNAASGSVVQLCRRRMVRAGVTHYECRN